MVDNTRGILAMSGAVVVFIFNDALIKLAAETVPAAQAIGMALHELATNATKYGALAGDAFLQGGLGFWHDAPA